MQPRREKREELAAFQLIELHSIPASQGPDLQDIELARISQEVAERFYNLVAVGEGGRCPSRVKDGPILSQARSRSKGPLSDQVADATKPRRQCRCWVERAPPSRVPSDCTTTLFASPRCLSDCVARKVKQNPRPFA